MSSGHGKKKKTRPRKKVSSTMPDETPAVPVEPNPQRKNGQVKKEPPYIHKPPDSMVAVWGLYAGITVAAIYALQYSAMLQSNQAVQRAFESSQRPMVSIGRKDGMVAEFVVPAPEMPNQNVGIKVYVQNGGQSPAITPNVSLINQVLVLGPSEMGQSAPPKFPLFQNKPNQLVRTTNKDGGRGTNARVGSISPQSEYVYYFPDQVSREQYESLIRRQRVAMVEGICEYCDVLGQYTCRSFSLFYYGSPFNAFAEVNEMDCAPMYTYLPAVSGQTYLLPCEQPDEREAREKQEKKELLKRASAPPPKAN
jgi:hypothetical protein